MPSVELGERVAGLPSGSSEQALVGCSLKVHQLFNATSWPVCDVSIAERPPAHTSRRLAEREPAGTVACVSPVPAPVRLLGLAVAACLSLAAPAAGASVTPSTGTVWACLPGVTPNPCDESLATTTLSSTTLQPRKVAGVATPPKEPRKGVDCFYVYPTVVSLPRQNAPRYVVPEVRSILRYQAARFSQLCDVYAPVYRQATLPGLVSSRFGGTTGDPTVAKPSKIFNTAYADVLGAWREYLAERNGGRGVVLIGHSQGSGMLTRLLREEIDPDATVRSKIVSAIVPGGNFTVAAGQRLGGDTDHVPTCASASETGCVLAWSLFASKPKASTLFGLAGGSLRADTGLPTRPGTEVACSNPARLSGDGGRLLPITRSEPFPGLIGAGLQLMFYGLPPRASTSWVIPGERYSAACQRTTSRGGPINVLRVKSAGAGTIVPAESPWQDWGLHLADVNLPLGNLIKIVRTQIDSYAANTPATS